MLAMNLSGFRYNHEEKIDQMTRFCKENQIDTLMLRIKNGKWTPKTTDVMSSKMK